jgi:hypothetical protein
MRGQAATALRGHAPPFALARPGKALDDQRTVCPFKGQAVY